MGAPPREFPLGTKFAEEFPRKRGTSFRRICELDPVRRVARCQPELASDSKKDRTPLGVLSFLEAPPRFGLGVEVLQTFALPLGHGAIFVFNIWIISQRYTVVNTKIQILFTL